ncbi:alpha/beta fold hydrolase [Corticicoccus populi]|uniref:Alpha/beta fold hydrolase n=1 Tax=Corticicoccus populi TaxID=1812821 RepID=A0ABW5WW93_9STAP
MILHTEITGNGAPLLFLHTALQTGAVELEDQREYFNQNYQVILPDLRGHGKSVTENFNLNNYFQDSVSDLVETLDDLNVQKVHLAGCSLGALAALHFAKARPDRVQSLMLSGIIPERPDNWEDINEKENKNIAELLKDEETAAYFDQLHDGDWRAVLQSTEGNDWYPFDQTKDLSDLHMPVLFIVGGDADLETIGAVKYPKENENIHASILPFAGHTVHLDQPELYNNILDQFLKQVV